MTCRTASTALALILLPVADLWAQQPPPAPDPVPAPAPAPDEGEAAPEAPAPAPETPEEPPAEEPAPEEPAPGEPATEEPATGDADPGAIPAGAPAELPQTGADWPFWGGGPDALRYSPLTQITPQNVGRLERVFVFRTGDMPSGETEGKYSPETTPLKIGGDLLLCSAMNILISIDAATGEENWRFDPGVPASAIPYGATCRGVAAWTDPAAAGDELCARRVVQATLDAKLVAVDLATGAPCEGFGENGTIDLWQDIGERVPGFYSVTSAPAIVRGVIVTGAQVLDGQDEDAPSGVVRGFDARTGELVWAWDLGAPEANRQGPPEGEVYTRGTPNMWTTAATDEELGMVYLPMGNSSVDYYGSNRTEAEDRYSTALVALDAMTGEVAWSFQTVRRDVWDYDLGSQPSLIDYEGTPALVLASKQGDIYILDRETGEPLTPVGELTGLPQGEIEPDYVSDTQPTSEWHTLRGPDIEERDMWGFSPIDQLWCRIMYRRANYQGFYTPPTASQPWIQYPGYNGGNDWGSLAIDVERGVIIANYNDIPNYNQLIPRDPENDPAYTTIVEAPETVGAPENPADPQAGSPYAIKVNAGWRNPLTGIPCTDPPFGGIRAIDMVTGETLWDRPLGTARRNGPWGIPSMLPFDIGTPNNGGPVITASGLIFIGAATDNLFRAMDITTGETLWSDTLPAGGQANPITYEVDGRQFVVISGKGHHFMETGEGDHLIGWALPGQ